ncbi:hypothetical protein, partial [Candidatus Methylacidiphilum fumarolicum]|uniref:hypothetical protein n=1 Tax=Candidatus Methylacidiphilum fumarolicum TaxID=591154 RepID=UPI001E5277C9
NRPQTVHRTARNAGIGRPSPPAKPKALAGALAARGGRIDGYPPYSVVRNFNIHSKERCFLD